MRAILRLVPVPLAASLMVLSAACSSDPPTGDASGAGGAVSVAAAFYPLAAAAETIGGPCVQVENLTPAGVEPHDLELTPDDVEALASSDLVLYLGSGFQPAVEDAIGDASGVTLDLLTLTKTRMPPAADAEEGLSVDPHVWLDPGLWAAVMPAIAGAMRRAAPEASCDLAANAERYAAQIGEIDEEFSRGLAGCDRDLIVTNHAAFGYLAAAHGLTQEAISGLLPDAEPTPERLAELRTLVADRGVTTIFSEALVSPEVAETLASEAGVRTAVLDTLEGLTPAQVEAGADYRSVMRANLSTLRGALGCT